MEKFRFKDESAIGAGDGTPITAEPFNKMLERIEILESMSIDARREIIHLAGVCRVQWFFIATLVFNLATTWWVLSL